MRISDWSSDVCSSDLPIASFQVVQHRCARMYTWLEQSRSLLLKAALAEEEARVRAVTAARAYIGDAALKLAEEAVQLHGGMGVPDELAIGRGLRRGLLLSRILEERGVGKEWVISVRCRGWRFH